MTAGSWQAVEKWLRAQVGVHEEGVSNRTIYAALARHPNGFAWCATFVSAAMRVNGVAVPSAVLGPSSRTMFATAKAAGLAVNINAARPGDVVHMTRGSISAWLGHVGVVVEVKPDGRLVTIEGNTNAAGSATGGSVLVHTRARSAWNLGAWRPPYAPASARLELWALTDGPDKGAIVQPRDGKSAKLLNAATLADLVALGLKVVPHAAVEFDR